jgi:hypothetical protein
LLFSEYLHEKAEESRHNETVSYLIIVTGSVFFVGGLLETIITSTIAGAKPEWFLIFPYHFTPDPDSLLGTVLTSVGIVLIFLGNSLGDTLCEGKILVHDRASQGTFCRGTEAENG